MSARSPRDPSARALAPSAALLAVAIAAVATLATLAAPARAQVWNEVGDAGQLPATAQSTTGVGPLATLNGFLQGPDDVDLYCIFVPDPAAFVAGLQCVVLQGPDLWLFDPTGKGVTMSALCSGGNKTITGAFLPGPGQYLIGVSYDAYYPFSGAGQIWQYSYLGDHAPDGPGAPLPVTSWTGQVYVQPINPYTIQLQGTTFCEAPVPALSRTWGGVKGFYR